MVGIVAVPEISRRHPCNPPCSTNSAPQPPNCAMSLWALLHSASTNSASQSSSACSAKQKYAPVHLPRRTAMCPWAPHDSRQISPEQRWLPHTCFRGRTTSYLFHRTHHCIFISPNDHFISISWGRQLHIQLRLRRHATSCLIYFRGQALFIII